MTRSEMESRRQLAIGELVAGAKVAELAKTLGVARISVYRWKQKAQKGESLACRKATGRPARMTAADVEDFKIYAPLGFRGTQDEFAKLIYFRTGVKYSPDHAGRLMHKWGLRPKRQRGSL